MLERLSLTNNAAKFPQKCSIQLKLAINRMRLHRTKKLEEGNRHKKQIADLLATDKEQLARVKTVSVIFEDYMIEALNMVEVYCETIVSRAQLLSAQKTCPLELKDAVCNIIYCAPYLAMEELTKLRKAFIKRYGKDFPMDCERNGYLNEKLISRLQHNPPDEALINYYLSAIAKKHNIDWEVPVGMLPTSILTPQPGAQQPQFPTYGYPPMSGQPGAQGPPPTSPPQPHHAPPSAVYYPAPGQFPASPSSPTFPPAHFTQGGMQQGGMSQGTSAIPSADSVDDLEARFRALSGQPGGGDGGGGGNLQSLQHGAVVQNSQPMPDFLDELDSMWKQSASAARAVEPALARVDAALAELEASARSVGAGKLLARSAVPPTNDEAAAALAAAVEALRQATSGLSSEAANGRPIGDKALTLAQALARLSDLSVEAAAQLASVDAQASALRAVRASLESGRVLLAAAEATGASPHDPSLRDRLGQASAGVAAAVKSLFAIHQQARQQQQQPAPQPSASSSSSADEAARAEIMKAAQALIAAATQLHETSTGAAPRKPPAGPKTGGWEDLAYDLGGLPPGLIPPAQHIAGAAGALLAAAAECQAERVQAMSTGPHYHADPAWTNGLVSASRAVTSTTFHALRLAVAVGKGEADLPTLQAALRAESAATELDKARGDLHGMRKQRYEGGAGGRPSS
ncbi:uncharacterized protein ACA1_197490 [Acanthamoeba castellanii str. Neff]|uniref:Talin IBS2B domain-containing protein n=1 Tax=Acanthamoeba castellanii (strain ATCC 30010 / Neff) TaxID=1257118 RepID=L8H2A4_ACACF|nr:uncharacterized protein ACA1_197490 [Acanthamoeba castellanii str. Neff]ELR19589.1 hypothetical protein ACA1_197490 [Acanthamoeba castellanii str. Neff]